MDITSLLGTFMASDSVSGLSQAANVSSDNTRSILSAALPALLNGALQQSTNEETAEGFANALTQHAAADTSNIGSFLGGVDLADGGKIISHLLGSGSTNTISQISSQTGASEKETSSVLSAAAPLLMSLLGQQTSSQQSSGVGIGSIMGSLLGGSDVSGILGGLLGGADKDGDGKPDGGLLSGLLGSLFK